MKKKFQYSSENGLIWKVIPNISISHLILLEVRSPTIFQTYFIILNIENESFFSFQLPEIWWVNSVSFDKNIIYFQFYADSEKPIPTEIWYYDIEKKELQDKKIYTPTTEIPIFQSHHWVEYYDENEKYFLTISQFLEHKFHLKPIENIAYSEKDNYIFIDFFVKNQSNIEEVFCIFDKKGNHIIKESNTLTENFYKGERLFFWNNYIILLEQRKKITIFLDI
jgi:hypothetical protein